MPADAGRCRLAEKGKIWIASTGISWHLPAYGVLRVSDRHGDITCRQMPVDAVRCQQITGMHRYLPVSTGIFRHLPAGIYRYLPASVSIYRHLPTSICRHLSASTRICLILSYRHLPASASICRHVLPSASQHLPASTSIYLILSYRHIPASASIYLLLSYRHLQASASIQHTCVHTSFFH